jgi:hypothetical protein
LGTARDTEGSSGGLTDIVFWYLPGGTEKHHGKLSHDSRCLGCGLRLPTAKYISEALPLEGT